MIKKINILGKEVCVTFNMATEISFEIISDTAFPPENPNSARNKYALYLAAISSCKENSKETIDYVTERLTNEATNEDLQAIDKAVGDCMLDFFHIAKPAIEPSSETEKEDSKKN